MKQRNNSQPFRAIRSKSCSICSTKIDYKDPKGLANFTSGRGKINPSRISSVCAKHQRQLRNFLIRARYLALLPYVTYRDSSNY